jgi:hypothetical protein
VAVIGFRDKWLTGRFRGDHEQRELAGLRPSSLIAGGLITDGRGSVPLRPVVRQRSGRCVFRGREKRGAAFAFDPKRSAVLLVAGNKDDVDQKRFSKRLIATADRRFDEHYP